MTVADLMTALQQLQRSSSGGGGGGGEEEAALAAALLELRVPPVAVLAVLKARAGGQVGSLAALLARWCCTFGPMVLHWARRLCAALSSVWRCDLLCCAKLCWRLSCAGPCCRGVVLICLHLPS
jgi:hypothetical protein